MQRASLLEAGSQFRPTRKRQPETLQGFKATSEDRESSKTTGPTFEGHSNQAYAQFSRQVDADPWNSFELTFHDVQKGEELVTLRAWGPASYVKKSPQRGLNLTHNDLSRRTELMTFSSRNLLPSAKLSGSGLLYPPALTSPFSGEGYRTVDNLDSGAVRSLIGVIYADPGIGWVEEVTEAGGKKREAAGPREGPCGLGPGSSKTPSKKRGRGSNDDNSSKESDDGNGGRKGNGRGGKRLSQDPQRPGSRRVVCWFYRHDPVRYRDCVVCRVDQIRRLYSVSRLYPLQMKIQKS